MHNFFNKINNKGFSLTEVLLTLAAIGVVAAFVIPNLTNNFIQKKNEVQVISFKQKFQEGMDTMRLRNQLMPIYDSTMDFVNAMKKHFNITQVCDSSHLSDCFEGDFTAISYDANGNETASKTFSPKDLSDTQSLVPSSDFNSDLVGVKFSDGTGAILTRDKNCSGPKNDEVNGDVFKCLGYIGFVGNLGKAHTLGKDMVTNMDLLSMSDKNNSENSSSNSNIQDINTEPETTCGENATNISGECKCNADYYGDGTTCNACASDKTSSIGSTSESDCKCKTGYDPWCLSFEIMAIVPANKQTCQSADYYNSNDTKYCNLSYEQLTNDVINRYNLDNRTTPLDGDKHKNWYGAMKYCQDRGWKLPNKEQYTEIQDKIYLTDGANCTRGIQNGQPIYTNCNSEIIKKQPLVQYLVGQDIVQSYFSSYTYLPYSSNNFAVVLTQFTDHSTMAVGGIGWTCSAICVK